MGLVVLIIQYLFNYLKKISFLIIYFIGEKLIHMGIGDWGFGVWGFGVWGQPQKPRQHNTTHKPQKKKK